MSETEEQKTAAGVAIIADGMRRLFDAARETERGCMEALQSGRVVSITHVDFGWLLRASRRGEEQDRASAVWQLVRRPRRPLALFS